MSPPAVALQVGTRVGRVRRVIAVVADGPEGDGSAGGADEEIHEPAAPLPLRDGVGLQRARVSPQGRCPRAARTPALVE